MDSKIWSITLCREAHEPIEPRVAKIIRYLANKYPDALWLIEDIDGLSSEADVLSQKMNDSGPFQISNGELMHVLEADGQVIELNAVLINEHEKYQRVVIRDGFSIDVVGKQGQMLPESIVGKYKEIDEGMYL